MAMSDDTTHDQADDQTHYDTLGVAPGAKPATIQKAWRKRTAKEGPGSAHLSELNEAAEVLLDPVRRAAYDAELAARRPDPEPEDTGENAGDDTGKGAGGRSRWRVVALVLLPILALGAIAVAVMATLEHREREASDRSATEALAVAENSLKAVLSYDYRDLEKDRARATPLLAPELRKEFDKTYDELLAASKGDTPGAAVQTKTVVTANTLGVAVMDASPDEVTVLAFVNQTSTHDGEQPRTFANRVRVVMVEQGGDWLISELDPR